MKKNVGEKYLLCPLAAALVLEIFSGVNFIFNFMTFSLQI
jgi:hypothetical protein